MTLRLGVDIDGVLADLGASLAALSRTGSAESTTPAAAAQTSSWKKGVGASFDEMFETSHLQGAAPEVWRRIAATENFWETLAEIEPGAVRQLERLVRARRWETIFLTSRPKSDGDPVQWQTQRWLEDKGFRWPSVLVTSGSRGRIARALALDVVVDDNPENCLDVAAQSHARSILVWRGASERVPTGVRNLGVGPVSTMAECLDLLERLDPSGHPAGLADRFRRVFGLRTKRPVSRSG